MTDKRINFDTEFYGFNIKDLIGIIITAIITTLIKDIISNFIESVTMRTEITIKISGTVILTFIITTAIIIVIMKRNKRVKIKIYDEQIKSIEKEHKKQLDELEEKHNKELLKYKIYPSQPINYDYVVECSRQDMIFHNKQEIYFTRTTSLKDIECNELNFKYFWSGSNVKSISLDDNDNYAIELPDKEENLPNIPLSNEYLALSSIGYPLMGGYKIVPLKGSLESAVTIKINFELTNENNKMDTNLSMNIQRPTDTLILCVSFPLNLGIKNIKVKRKLLFGDYKDEMLSKKKYSINIKKYGIAASDKGISYKVIIDNPEMFYCYMLSWEWR